MLSSNPQDRLERARVSLEGLSVGDSLGGFFEMSSPSSRHTDRRLPSAPWHFTDDTNMALSIYSVLRKYGEINQDILAQSFAEHFDRLRGYGMGARTLLNRVRKGEDWRTVSNQMFGEGSFGNGGAMRVAPLGAYFADALELAISQARLSSEITHAHPEGIAGAIAAAVAAAVACRLSGTSPIPRQEFALQIMEHIPESDVKAGIKKAHDLPDDLPLHEVTRTLSNGQRVTAQDTVPFVIWCAGTYLDNYDEAIWQAIAAGGDTDTTAAMIGGIVACYTGKQSIPEEWTASREPLPDWAFQE